MDCWVIDASVYLALHLGEKRFAKALNSVIEDYLQGVILPLAPTIQHYEIMSGLQTVVSRGKIGPYIIDEAMADTFELEIEYRTIYLNYEHLSRFCRQYKCTVYNAAYLVLAEQEKARFLTADKKLYKVLHPHLDWVIWLGDYPKIGKKNLKHRVS